MTWRLQVVRNTLLKHEVLDLVEDFESLPEALEYAAEQHLVTWQVIDMHVESMRLRCTHTGHVYELENIGA